MNQTIPWPSPESLPSSFLCHCLLVSALEWIMAVLVETPACGWGFPGLRVTCLLPALTYLFRWVCPWYRPQWMYVLLSEDGHALYTVTIKKWDKDSVWGKDLLANLINVLMFPLFFPVEIVYGSDYASLVIVTVRVDFFSYILEVFHFIEGSQTRLLVVW